jgi:hypothetical protein
MIDLHQPQWLAAPSSRGYSTIPEGKLIMSKDATASAEIIEAQPQRGVAADHDAALSAPARVS